MQNTAKVSVRGAPSFSSLRTLLAGTYNCTWLPRHKACTHLCLSFSTACTCVLKCSKHLKTMKDLFHVLIAMNCSQRLTVIWEQKPWPVTTKSYLHRPKQYICIYTYSQSLNHVPSGYTWIISMLFQRKATRFLAACSKMQWDTWWEMTMLNDTYWLPVPVPVPVPAGCCKKYMQRNANIK